MNVSGSSLRRAVSAGLISLCAVALSGCLSIPVSTIYKLSRLNDQDIANLDPADIRAVVEVPESTQVDTDKIRIQIKVTQKNGASSDADGDWAVVQVAQGHYVPVPIRVAKPGYELYLYRLSDEARAGLAKVLARVRENPKDLNVALTINLDGAFTAPKGTRGFAFRPGCSYARSTVRCC